MNIKTILRYSFFSHLIILICSRLHIREAEMKDYEVMFSLNKLAGNIANYANAR